MDVASEFAPPRRKTPILERRRKRQIITKTSGPCPIRPPKNGIDSAQKTDNRRMLAATTNRLSNFFDLQTTLIFDWQTQLEKLRTMQISNLAANKVMAEMVQMNPLETAY